LRPEADTTGPAAHITPRTPEGCQRGTGQAKAAKSSSIALN
jgi:hypothetical protein